MPFEVYTIDSGAGDENSDNSSEKFKHQLITVYEDIAARRGQIVGSHVLRIANGPANEFGHEQLFLVAHIPRSRGDKGAEM